MSILGTGRTNLAQADYASKASTGMANARAANQANIDIAENNSKQSMRGQALGTLGSAGLAAYGSMPTAAAGVGSAGSVVGGAAGAGALNAGLGSTVGTAGALTQPVAASVGNTIATNTAFLNATGGAATTAAPVATTTVGTAAAGAAGAESAAAAAAAKAAAAGGTAAAGSTGAAAVIPYIGPAIAIGMLAYSLFS